VKLRTQRATYRYELRSIALIARYGLVFVGLLLATSFTTSVLYDDADIARAAWLNGAVLLGGWGLAATLLLPFVWVATALARRGRLRRLASVELSKEALVLRHDGGETRFAWAQLRSGFVEPREDGRVRLSLELAGGLREGDRVELVGEAELGEALSQRLERAPARYDLGTRSYRYGAALASLALFEGCALGLHLFDALEARVSEWHGHPGLTLLGPQWALGLVAACVGGVALLLQLASITPTIVLGADGVIVERLLGSRFVPFASMRAVHTSVLGLRIELQSGASVRVWALGMSPERVAAFAARIAERIAESGASEASLPRLEAGGARWADEVVHRATASDYRTSTPSDDALVRALDAPGTPSDLRVAAAVALRAREGRRSAKTIRVAARRLADEPTRALLERLAEEEADLDEVEAALSKRGARGA
jgi:hypothetical protein